MKTRPPFKSQKDRPLSCTVINGVLSIVVGVDTLALADKDRHGLDITNNEGFAKDVAIELSSEREDGSTILTDVLDKAIDAAADNGSAHVRHNDPARSVDEVIRALRKGRKVVALVHGYDWIQIGDIAVEDEVITVQVSDSAQWFSVDRIESVRIYCE